MHYFDYSHIEPYFPGIKIGWHAAVLFEREWGAFYKNPAQFKGTDLPTIIAGWLAEELPQWEQDEYGDWRRK